jgi:hypothetical protein
MHNRNLSEAGQMDVSESGLLNLSEDRMIDVSNARVLDLTEGEKRYRHNTECRVVGLSEAGLRTLTADNRMDDVAEGRMGDFTYTRVLDVAESENWDGHLSEERMMNLSARGVVGYSEARIRHIADTRRGKHTERTKRALDVTVLHGRADRYVANARSVRITKDRMIDRAGSKAISDLSDITAGVDVTDSGCGGVDYDAQREGWIVHIPNAGLPCVAPDRMDGVSKERPRNIADRAGRWNLACVRVLGVTETEKWIVHHAEGGIVHVSVGGMVNHAERAQRVRNVAAPHVGADGDVARRWSVCVTKERMIDFSRVRLPRVANGDGMRGVAEAADRYLAGAGLLDDAAGENRHGDIAEERHVDVADVWIGNHPEGAERLLDVTGAVSYGNLTVTVPDRNFATSHVRGDRYVAEGRITDFSKERVWDVTEARGVNHAERGE